MTDLEYKAALHRGDAVLHRGDAVVVPTIDPTIDEADAILAEEEKNLRSTRWENVSGKALKDWATAIMHATGCNRKEARLVVLMQVRMITKELSAKSSGEETTYGKCKQCICGRTMLQDVKAQFLSSKWRCPLRRWWNFWKHSPDCRIS
jgi:hypothetical protein